MRSIVVVSGGVSNPSTTTQVATDLAKSTQAAVGARGESADITVIELRTMASAIANAVITGTTTPEIDAAFDALKKADGIIAVSPVFSASYSGLFKLFFDIMDKDLLQGKPVLIAATAGTPRHSLVLEYAMRPLFTYFRSYVIPISVFVATEDFAGTEDSEGDFEKRVTKAAGQLASQIVKERDHVGGLGGFTADGFEAEDGTQSAPFLTMSQGHLGD